MHLTIVLNVFPVEATCDKSVILDQHKKIQKVCTVYTTVAINVEFAHPQKLLSAKAR